MSVGDAKLWLCLLVVLMLAAQAVAAASGVVVSPAKIVMDARLGTHLPPISVTNKGSHPVKVTVSVGKGRHDVGGVPILDGGVSPTCPQSPLTVFPTEFELGPGQKQTVSAQVIKPVRGGIYPVIYFSIDELEKTRQSGTQPSSGIAVTRRLAVLTLLTEPGSTPPSPKITGIRLHQDQKGAPVSLVSVVTNPGDRHLIIEGEVLVQGQTRRAFHLPVQAVTVLPGCSRELNVAWRPNSLPAGTYQGTWSLQVRGGAAVSAGFGFDVVRPYELARPALDLEGWQAYAAGATGEISAAGVVRNGGNVGLSPVLLLNAEGTVQVPSEPVEVGYLEPGQARLVRVSLPFNGSEAVEQLEIKVLAQAGTNTVSRTLGGIKVGRADAVALSK